MAKFTVEYDARARMERLSLHSTTWITLINIILSKRSQTEIKVYAV